MRKCFERCNDRVKIDEITNEKVSILAQEVVNRLLAENPSIDTWDLETLFNNEFGYYYSTACLKEQNNSRK